MSYILDALRKADSERQRGAVPGLHDQSAPAHAAGLYPSAAGRSGRTHLVMAGLALALVVALGLYLGRGLWWTPSPPPAERQAGAGSPAAATPVLPSPTPPVPPEAVVTPNSAPNPALQPPAPSAAPKAVPPPPASTVASTVAPAAAPTAAPPVLAAAPTSAPAPTVAPAPAALPRLADLAEAQRRELPPLVVGGVVQSSDPASRMLIVDGQVLREGDAPMPGLVLERIGPRAAVFSLRGLRFELPL